MTRSGAYAGIGSRETPMNVLIQMKSIALMLARSGWTLRSGRARGADQWFEAGAGIKKEIFLMGDAMPAAIIHAMKHHPAWHKLTDEARLLHARNSMVMLGKRIDSPVEFVCCWTSNGGIVGGTGQALRIAEKMGIPVFNLYWPTAEEQLMKFLGDSK